MIMFVVRQYYNIVVVRVYHSVSRVSQYFDGILSNKQKEVSMKFGMIKTLID